MEYTAKQIENAKRNYNAMMRLHTLADYNVEIIGINTAEQRMEYHNRIVTAIRNGDKQLEREWKLFFLEEEVKKDKYIIYSKTQKDDDGNLKLEYTRDGLHVSDEAYNIITDILMPYIKENNNN